MLKKCVLTLLNYTNMLKIMGNKAIGNQIIVAISVSIGFLGFLVDFQEVATKIFRLYPYLSPFLPLIALSGMSAFVLYALFLIFYMHPYIKWGRIYKEKCAEFLTELDEHLSGKKAMPQFYSKASLLSVELGVYKIVCPPVRSNNLTCQEIWKYFILLIVMCARRNDLRAARATYKQMKEEEVFKEMLDRMDNDYESTSEPENSAR